MLRKDAQPPRLGLLTLHVPGRQKNEANVSKDLQIIPSFMLMVSVMSSIMPAAQVTAQSQPTGETAAVEHADSSIVPGMPSVDENAKSQGVAVDTAKESSQGSATPSPVIARTAFSPCEKTLATRVEARWQAMIDHDFATAYQFTLPSYREANSLEQFKSRFGAAVTWRGAKVTSLQYVGPETVRLSVDLEVEYVPSWGGDKQKAITAVDETWLSREGSWWLSLSR